jgi:hypothetical protein
VLDEAAKTLVCTLLSVGFSRRQAAAYARVSHTTIGYAVAHDGAFAARVEKAEQMAIAKPVITIADLKHGNWKAAIWLLERNERRLGRMNCDTEVPSARSSRRAGIPAEREK